MFRVVVFERDTFTVEVIVEMLHFLVAGKEHQPSAAAGRSFEIFDKRFLFIGRDICRECHFHHPLLTLPFFSRRSLPVPADAANSRIRYHTMPVL